MYNKHDSQTSCHKINLDELTPINYSHGAGDKAIGRKRSSEWIHLDIAGSIPTTGKNNGKYLTFVPSNGL